MDSKICNRCGIEKPLVKFVKDKRKEDGTRNYCLECDRLRKGGKPKKIVREGYKYCAKCNQELSLSDFNTRTVNGKKQPFSYCKKCERDYNNNMYKHTCKECGETYRTGRKDSVICSSCYHKQVGKYGAKRLNKIYFSGSNNPMYGVRRFGVSNPNYNPTKTEQEREQGRLVEGYGVWRNNVYERDNFTCQKCFDSTGGNLIAHHIDSWDWAKDKRLDTSNGITLCKTCHKSFHDRYGYGKNTFKQISEFIHNQVNTEITL